MEKALVAMSGGVDSSVALYLMKEQGYDCTGITMKLFNNEDACVAREKACCSLKDIEDARSVSYALGVPYYVFNFTADFKAQVIDHFIEAYQNGATPNPCIDCNRYIKFERLFLRAKQLEMDYVVTGHYANRTYDTVSGRYLLQKGIDDSKDQSYVLYAMTQEQLKHTLFPVGNLPKTAVREIAEKLSFINAKKRDSQDICFVVDGDYAGFIRQHNPKLATEGNFVDLQGNVLGKHKGTIHYTVGQRKGIGIAFQTPMFVHSIQAQENTVTLCASQELYSSTLTASDFNWIAVEDANKPMRVKAKVRYKQTEQWAWAEQISKDQVQVTFDQPQRAITPGQAVVLYDGDVVVGGGTIL